MYAPDANSTLNVSSVILQGQNILKSKLLQKQRAEKNQKGQRQTRNQSFGWGKYNP